MYINVHLGEGNVLQISYPFNMDVNVNEKMLYIREEKMFYRRFEIIPASPLFVLLLESIQCSDFQKCRGQNLHVFHQPPRHWVSHERCCT